jgi:hypothetical protein
MNELSNKMIELSDQPECVISLDVYVNTMILLNNLFENNIRKNPDFIEQMKKKDSNKPYIYSALFNSIIVFNSITSLHPIFAINFGEFNTLRDKYCNMSNVMELLIKSSFYPVVTHIMYLLTRESVLNSETIKTQYNILDEPHKVSKIREIMSYIIRFYSGESSYTGPLTIWQLVQYSVIKVFGMTTRTMDFDISDDLIDELDKSFGRIKGGKRRRLSKRNKKIHINKSRKSI